MDVQKGRGRGFASMTAEKKREIASKGGKTAQALGTAHKWTSEEAARAGRKGGSISRRPASAPVPLPPQRAARSQPPMQQQEPQTARHAVTPPPSS